MMACPTLLSPAGDFLSGVLGYVDCQAQTIGMSGYQALAAPGSTVSVVLTSALTFFVALFGYRLLFGQVPGMRDVTVALVKISFVLVLATSWPAFRTLAYDVVLHAPSELAGQVGGGAGLPGAGGGLVARLQGIDAGLIELLELGTGRPTDADAVASPVVGFAQQQDVRRLPGPLHRQHWDPAQDAILLGEARTAYLAATIAAFASVRLVAGLLLALGPLFAMFLLFDATRGIFEGWVRGLAGAALGALSTVIVLGVETALLEPWLGAILIQRRADISTPTVPIELLVVMLAFGLTLLAALIASARIAQTFRLPATLWQVSHGWFGAVAGEHQVRALPIPTSLAVSTVLPERARAVAMAAAAVQRREQDATAQSFIRLGDRDSRSPISARGPELQTIGSIGQGARRRTSTRVSASANRRDRA